MRSGRTEAGSSVGCWGDELVFEGFFEDGLAQAGRRRCRVDGRDHLRNRALHCGLLGNSQELPIGEGSPAFLSGGSNAMPGEKRGYSYWPSLIKQDAHLRLRAMKSRTACTWSRVNRRMGDLVTLAMLHGSIVRLRLFW